jgi:predicted nucleotidyltransferase
MGTQTSGPLNDARVQEIVQRIVETAPPEKIILFGSRARGEVRPNSDFDVLVIKESAEPRYRRSAPLYVALADLPAEVEVMVYTPEEVEEWSQVPQAFVTTAVREGKVIYERPCGP